jgi:putative membrane protein
MSKIRASAYTEVEPTQLTLRDHLARDRTILANERTLLAYVRTAFGFAAAGMTLIKLFPGEPGSQTMGFWLLVSAALLAIVGVVRFWMVRSQMKRIILPRRSNVVR